MEIDLNKVYIITNGTGLFALNTWLYLFFGNINLLGTSIRDTTADGIKSCAWNMLAHDELHTIIINMYMLNNDVILSYEKIYYNILNSEDLDTNHKELFILFLFITIHEILSNDYSNFDENFNFLFKRYLNFFYRRFSFFN